jgi:threonine/homoserine/homoserine lactone efflux protein
VRSNVLNPKTAVFSLALLPQCIGPTDSVLQQSLLLAAIHDAEGLVWLVGVAMAVEQTRRLFLQATIWRWLDGICGTLFIGFGVRLALQRQSSVGTCLCSTCTRHKSRHAAR